MASEELQDFDKEWNYRKPDVTEKKFREYLLKAREKDDKEYLGQLLTQLARSIGLQKRFEEAHEILDEADKVLGETSKVGRVRYLLERGRTHNSSGKAEEARALFEQAYELGQKVGAEWHTIDAVHMLGFSGDPEVVIKWNRKGLELAKQAKSEKARGWAATLYQNLGYTLLQEKRYDEALAVFKEAVTFCEKANYEDKRRVMKWFLGKTLRDQGKPQEALAVQQALLKEYEEAGKEEAGYTTEEIGECLWALDRKEEARPYLALAYKRLSKLKWLEQAEPKRLESLKRRAGLDETGGD